MEGTKRFSEAVTLAAVQQELDNKKWQKVKEQYENLDKFLEKITDKRVHECMVPISKGKFHKYLNLIFTNI